METAPDTARVADFISAGEAAMREGRVDDALRAADAALAALGDGYRDPATVDDTGMKLALSQGLAARGDRAAAARARLAVATARLEMLKGRGSHRAR